MSRLTRRAALAAAAAALRDAQAQTASPPVAPPVARVNPLPPKPRPEGPPLFGARQRKLENGLSVVQVEQRRAPVVAQYLFVGAGAGDDPAGRSGVAHFLEHMAFKGSPNVPSGAFSRRIAQQGGQDNAFTSRDVTAYHQHVEASRLGLIAQMESDRFREMLLPEAELESERQVILEERNQRVDSSPQARFREAMAANLWGPQHWKGRPIIGWAEEIRAITRDDLKTFLDTWYAPGNAVLVIAGSPSEAELNAVVEKHYAPLPAHGPAGRGPRLRAEPPIAPLQARLARNEARVTEASITRVIAAPSLTWGEMHMAQPLEVLAHLLGGGPGSRLHKALVQSGLAVSAGAYYDADTLGASEFTLYATARRGTDLGKLEAALNMEIERLIQAGVSEAEVERSIRQLTAGALLALDGLGAAPRLIGSALAIGLPIESVEYWPAAIRAVTAAEVGQAAKAILPSQLAMVGWLGPEGITLPA